MISIPTPYRASTHCCEHALTEILAFRQGNTSPSRRANSITRSSSAPGARSATASISCPVRDTVPTTAWPQLLSANNSVTEGLSSDYANSWDRISVGSVRVEVCSRPDRCSYLVGNKNREVAIATLDMVPRPAPATGRHVHNRCPRTVNRSSGRKQSESWARSVSNPNFNTRT